MQAGGKGDGCSAVVAAAMGRDQGAPRVLGTGPCAGGGAVAQRYTAAKGGVIRACRMGRAAVRMQRGGAANTRVHWVWPAATSGCGGGGRGLENPSNRGRALGRQQNQRRGMAVYKPWGGREWNGQMAMQMGQGGGSCGEAPATNKRRQSRQVARRAKQEGVRGARPACAYVKRALMSGQCITLQWTGRMG